MSSANPQAEPPAQPTVTSRLQRAFESAFLQAAGAAAAEHKDALLALARAIFPGVCRRASMILATHYHRATQGQSVSDDWMRVTWQNELDSLKIQGWEAAGLGQAIVDSLLDQSFTIIGTTFAAFMLPADSPAETS